jgi:hypothetical protein
MKLRILELLLLSHAAFSVGANFSPDANYCLARGSQSEPLFTHTLGDFQPRF